MASGCVATAVRPALPCWISGSFAIPNACSRSARSAARSGVATETSSGWWREIWREISSRFFPAASADTPKRSGIASTTASVWRPMEPVDPRMEIFFTAVASIDLTLMLARKDPASRNAGSTEGKLHKALGSNSAQDKPLEIVPDCGGGKNQGIDAVQHPAMAGEECSGILDAGTALKCRFENVPHLACNAAECSHRKHMRQRKLHPIREHCSHDQCSEQIRACSLPCLVGT